MALIVANLIHGFFDPLKYGFCSIQGTSLKLLVVMFIISQTMVTFQVNVNMAQHEVRKQELFNAI